MVTRHGTARGTRRGRGVATRLVIGLLACVGALTGPSPAPVGAQTGVAPAVDPTTTTVAGNPRAARFALVMENAGGSAAADLLLDAAVVAITGGEPGASAFWFTLGAVDYDAARAVQAEMLALLSVQPATDSDTYLVRLQFFAVPARPTFDPDEPVTEAVVEVEIDRGGRYQREQTWVLLQRGVERVIAAARPVVPVTLRATPGVQIELIGLPPWAVPRHPTGASEAGSGLDSGSNVTLDLRSLRSYDVTVAAAGHRTQSMTFYVERDPLEIDLGLHKYPRHSVSFMARGLSWPGVEYAWYDRRTRWTMHAGVTSFLFGLTPLRQIGSMLDDDDQEPPERSVRATSSLPLTEVELGGGRLFGDRDRPARWHLGVAGVLRVTHLDGVWEVEPTAPTALRLAVGRERELSSRFVLSQRLATDVFWPVQGQFLREPPWAVTAGPVLWQLPLYRLGVRVVL